jgi:glucose-6-phosphate 1-dehydrogenase
MHEKKYHAMSPKNFTKILSFTGMKNLDRQQKRKQKRKPIGHDTQTTVLRTLFLKMVAPEVV